MLGLSISISNALTGQQKADSVTELVINGDFATNSDWVFGGSGGIISGGQLTINIGGSVGQLSGLIPSNTQVNINIQGSGLLDYRFDMSAGSAPLVRVPLPYSATVNTGGGNTGIQLLNLTGSVIIDSVSVTI
jgi:hypothetical protein